MVEKICQNCLWHFDLLGHATREGDPKNCLAAPTQEAIKSTLLVPSSACLYPLEFRYKGNWGQTALKVEKG
jgi:hypothetical protein